MTARQQPVMPNPLETRRQHMGQKAADELGGRQLDGAAAACCRRIAHPERHLAIGEANDAVIRDRHPVGIARQIVEHLGRPARRAAQALPRATPPRSGLVQMEIASPPEVSLPGPRLLDQTRDRLRRLHYSMRTEESYADWVKRLVRFHRLRHLRDIAAPEVKCGALVCGIGQVRYPMPRCLKQ